MDFLADNYAIWSAAELDGYYSETLEHLAQTCKGHTKWATVPWIDEYRAHQLPDDCLEIVTVHVNGQKAFGTRERPLTNLDVKYPYPTSSTPWLYYADDLGLLSIYPAPLEDPTYVATFDSELGTVVEITEDGTDATFTSDLGIIIDILDTASSTYIMENPYGVVTALASDGAIVVQVEYIYKPGNRSSASYQPPLSSESTWETTGALPDVPAYAQEMVRYGALHRAFAKEGPGKNPTLSEFFKLLFDEWKSHWKARVQTKAKSQLISQRPVEYGTDLDFKLRVWR